MLANALLGRDPESDLKKKQMMLDKMERHSIIIWVGFLLLAAFGASFGLILLNKAIFYYFKFQANYFVGSFICLLLTYFLIFFS